jgi:MYXO-CTERM domain-containing protein
MSDTPDRVPEGVPGDPLETNTPHDVLAAEEFGIPTREQRIPADPTGLEEAHDVLAAEEFAMPAGADTHRGEGGPGPRAWLPLAAIALALIVLLRRRRA